MKLKYEGRFNGNAESLPMRKVYPDDFRMFREPVRSSDFFRRVNTLIIVITLLCIGIVLRHTHRSFGGLDLNVAWSLLGGLALSVVCSVLHEFLHVLCFREDAYMYLNKGMNLFFVIGTEDFTVRRYVFMCLLPNIVFGFVPFIVFLCLPHLMVLGFLGAFVIGAGAGDYLNVINTCFQVPKGGIIFMSGLHTYWYRG